MDALVHVILVDGALGCPIGDAGLPVQQARPDFHQYLWHGVSYSFILARSSCFACSSRGRSR